MLLEDNKVADRAIRTTMCEYFTSNDPVKLRSIQTTLDQFVRTVCREEFLVRRDKPVVVDNKEVLYWIEGFVPLFKDDLFPNVPRITDIRLLLRTRTRTVCTTLSEEEWIKCDVELAQLCGPDMMRLLCIAKLARMAVDNSTGFISAWEFERHHSNVDGEQLHDRLKELMSSPDHIDGGVVMIAAPELQKMKLLMDAVKECVTEYNQPFAHNAEGDRLRDAIYSIVGRS